MITNQMFVEFLFVSSIDIIAVLQYIETLWVYKATLIIFFGPRFLRQAENVPEEKKKLTFVCFFIFFPPVFEPTCMHPILKNFGLKTGHLFYVA